MAAQKVPFVTPAEYLAGERYADVKHEYIAGEVYAMAGASPEHSAIATDTRRALGNGLAVAGSSCEVYDSDLKVRVADAGPFFYPDATVVCDDPTFDPDGCLRSPVVLIEVLSEGTASYDRGEKFRQYRRIASLRHYVLIEQDRILVEHYERLENGIWGLVGEHSDPADAVVFADLGVTLPLAEIYRRVRFSQPPAP
jgi:Uma2 family endonuclease